jgi:hypothetical protein
MRARVTSSNQNKHLEMKAYKGRKFTDSGNKSKKVQSPQKREIPVKQSLNKDVAANAANAANEEGMFYFSCRGDYWWRAVHSYEDNKVLCALATTHLALSLPSSELEVRECTPLTTRLDAGRNIELDSCFSISANNIELKAPENNQNPEELRILKNINRHGVMVFAEMQQQKQTIVDDDGVKIDKLPSRMDSYANFIGARDHGEQSKNVRAGKIEGDEIPRSVVGVAYYCYDDIGTIKQSAYSHSGALQNSNSARGTAIATVSLGGILKREEFIKQAKEQTADWKPVYEKMVSEHISKLRQDVDRHLSAFSNDTKQLVSEILAVFSMSHLFTKNIVDRLLPVVQNICNILEVNMENIQKVGLSDEQVEQIVGKFQNAERKTKNVVRFYKELKGNQDPMVQQKLLAKYGLTERDIEVSGNTTPRNSPSKPKAGNSPSSSKKH